MSDAIAKAPIRRMMKDVGAYTVADDAVVAVIGHLESLVAKAMEAAGRICDDDKRKTVTAGDLSAAFEQL